jgi:hypothetical protein
MGCHGRAEDNTGIAAAGAGLRQHHFNAGEAVCFDCHEDADPGSFTPAAEKVLPPYYFTPDTAHPNKPRQLQPVGKRTLKAAHWDWIMTETACTTLQILIARRRYHVRTMT